MYKYNNQTNVKVVYKCFRGLHPTAWMAFQNTGSIQCSKIVKACILLGKNGVPAVNRNSAIMIRVSTCHRNHKFKHIMCIYWGVTQDNCCSYLAYIFLNYDCEKWTSLI